MTDRRSNGTADAASCASCSVPSPSLRRRRLSPSSRSRAIAGSQPARSAAAGAHMSSSDLKWSRWRRNCGRRKSSLREISAALAEQGQVNDTANPLPRCPSARWRRHEQRAVTALPKGGTNGVWPAYSLLARRAANASPLRERAIAANATVVTQRAVFINHLWSEPVGSPLVRVLFTKGMIVADFLGDPDGYRIGHLPNAPVRVAK